MTVEYIFLGGLLIVMGAVQTWLRHGPGSKALEEADRSRRPTAGQGTGQQPPRGGVRSGRVWQSWTAVLGMVSIVLGLVLVVLGIMGR
jgi:hypothetical protein